MIERTSGPGSSLPPFGLPDKPSAAFLRKLAKDRLRIMRALNSAARLHEAQLNVAREHGFRSWRELAAHLNNGQRGNVVRQGDRVFIEGIAPMTWSASKCTYLAAMASVLRVIGPPHNEERLHGDSGIAFRMRFWSDDAGAVSSPLNPGAEFRPWTTYTERSIGWTMRWENCMAEERTAPADMSDRLDEIKASIDAGLPALGYMKSWHVGIAYGYEHDGLLVRDVNVGETETMLRIEECRGLFAFFEQRTSLPSRVESAQVAIEEAVSRWSCPPDRTEGAGADGAYYYGSEAYQRWTELLRRVNDLTDDQQRAFLYVDFLTFKNLYSARQKAAPYLRGIAELFPMAASTLREAASIYQQIGESAGQIMHEGRLFPAFYMPDAMGRWTKDVRCAEMKVLNAIRALDERAIGLLRKAEQSLTSAE